MKYLFILSLIILLLTLTISTSFALVKTLPRAVSQEVITLLNNLGPEAWEEADI